MERILVKEAMNHLEKKVKVKGWVHRIRALKKITFIILRDRSGLIQCIADNDKINIKGIKLETVVEIQGKLIESKNDVGPAEIQIQGVNILSLVNEDLPLGVNTPSIEENLDTLLQYRTLSLRRQYINDIFRIEALIAQGFAEYLINNDFVQIFSPKIVSEGAEGGTAIFKVKYFEREAYLAQSPQFYKQMMVGVYERVFEIGHVYRAEEHNTSRHLNEYVSLDLEMGFIENEKDIMNLETELLKYIFRKIKSEANEILERLDVELPVIPDRIPEIKLSEAIRILEKEYGKSNLEGDLDPEGEKLICEYINKNYGTEFVFLTHYPRFKRPMYTMPCGEETNSFDLLFRGLEITTGGQRIHSINLLVDNMKAKELNPESYSSYLEVFRYGMPPHGGLAIGLERLTAQLLKLKNVREATLFPRDRTRLIP